MIEMSSVYAARRGAMPLACFDCGGVVLNLFLEISEALGYWCLEHEVQDLDFKWEKPNLLV